MKKRTILMIFALLFLMAFAVGMVACSKPGIYIPGIYTGTSRGMGPITVELTVDDNSITAVNILGPGETQGVGGYEAINDGTFINGILEAQSPIIDTVSGATLTSNGVIAATEDALSQALREE